MRIIILTEEDILEEKNTTSVGMRQLELAKRWMANHDVTVATTYGQAVKKKRQGISLLGGVQTLDFIIGNYDIVVIELSTSLSSIAYRFVTSSINLPTIVDSYYAILFEKLVSLSHEGTRENILLEKLHVMSSILDYGDHFIVATEKQRDYMLGLISSRGKIHVGSFSKDMVSVLPNTLNVSFSRNKTKRLRGQLTATDDKIILWLGGVYPWFNPESLIKAMPAILKISRAKLFIIGGKNPTVGFDYVYQGAKKAASELGKDNSRVVFIDWVAKEQSFAYCSEADVFVILSKPTLEDEFAYRTRTLTALTLGIPVVTNGRDYLSGLITKYHAGIVCATDSPEEVASALSGILLDDGERNLMSDNTKKVIKEIQRDIDEQPLLNFFKQPTRTQFVRMSPLGRLRLSAKTFLSH